MMREWKVGILLFDEAEVLDFAGPYEVFSIAAREDGSKPFSVSILAERPGPVQAVSGLMVQPQYSFADAPALDILLVPGGRGASQVEIHNENMLRFLRERAKATPILASVCTGAFLLAKAGLLDGKAATTHWSYLDRFAEAFPNVRLQSGVKFVEDGDTLTSAGVSAGIDLALHIVKRLLGEEIARMAAKRMEYDAVL